MRYLRLACLYLCLFLFTLVGPAVLSAPVQVLHSWGISPAASSIWGVVAHPNGWFYVTSRTGGAHGCGFIYRVSKSGEYEPLFHFSYSETNPAGIAPNSRLAVGRDGNLYGTTSVGGANGYGTVFRMTPAGEHKVLVHFTAGDISVTGKVVAGSDPLGVTLGPDGNFYGMTSGGGTDDGPTAFKVSPAGVHATLADPGIETATPTGELVLGKDGHFYGADTYGGSATDGCVFRMTKTGQVTVIAEFDGNGPTPGYQPYGPLVQGTDGKLYGNTLSSSGTGAGTVFSVTPGGVLTTPLQLTNHYGVYPVGDLVRGNDGAIFGMTEKGVFKISTSGAVSREEVFVPQLSGGCLVAGPDGQICGLSIRSEWGENLKTGFFKITENGIVESAFGSKPPVRPVGSLAEGADGCFYGTTARGGAADQGTIFKMTRSGACSTLIEFTGSVGPYKGGSPNGSLVRGTDGSFYGTTSGPDGFGTIFKVTSEGAFTTLVEFRSLLGSSSGFNPQGGLLLAPDGNFYGTTSQDTSGQGTVFRLTQAGALTQLVVFTGAGGANPGYSPCGSLILGSDGRLYGTTGKPTGAGTVFSLSLDGEMAVLAAVGSPGETLTAGADGHLYGVSNDSVNSHVFRITLQGERSKVHEFSSENPLQGGPALTPLTLGSDGALYGMTQSGGTRDFGTLYKVTSQGQFTLLADLDGGLLGGAGRGNEIPVGFVEGSDGHLYGLTPNGGRGGGGTVLRLNLSPEMRVSGNGRPIENNDSLPDLADHTDFGEVNLAGGKLVRVFTLSNIGGAPLLFASKMPFEISGEHAGDFVVSALPAATLAAERSVTFKVTFDPAGLGLRQAVLRISPQGREVYSFHLQGKGADTKKPVVKITAPTGRTVSGQSPLKVAGTATDDMEIVRIEAILNGGAPQVWNVTTAKGDFTGEIAPVPGANTLSITAYDTAGNSTTVTSAFTFERRYGLEVFRQVPESVTAFPDKAGVVTLTALPASKASVLAKGPASQTSTVVAGTVLKLTATSKPGYLFSHWEGLPETAAPAATAISFGMPETDLQVKAIFVQNPLAGLYGSKATVFQGLLRPDRALVNIDTLGFVSAALTPAKGVLSGKVYIGGSAVPFTAVMNADGSVWFKKGAGYAELLEFQGKKLSLHWEGGLMTLALEGQGGVLSSGLASAPAAPAAGLLDANGKSGLYTMILAGIAQTPPRPVTSFPSGSGYASLTLTSSGSVNVTGMLADGSKITSSGFLNTGDSSPFFVQLPTPGASTKLSSFSGTLQFNPELRPDDDVISTDLLWIRPAVPEGKNPATHLYTSGWPDGLALDGAGARYDPAVTLQESLGCGPVEPEGNAYFGAEAGRLSEQVLRNINVDGNKIVKLDAADKSFTLTFTPKTGLIQGTYTPDWSNPAKTLPKFTGLLIQAGSYEGAHGFSISNALQDTDPESSNVSVWRH